MCLVMRMVSQSRRSAVVLMLAWLALSVMVRSVSAFGMVKPPGADSAASFREKEPGDWSIPASAVISIEVDIRNSRTIRDRSLRTKPVHSLVNFLSLDEKEEEEISSSSARHSLFPFDTPPSESFVQAFSQSTIQAVRSAGRAGDFRLIFRVVEAAISFAASCSYYYPEPVLLSPRLLGEAIDNLAKTKANASKLRQMWQLGKTHASLFTEPISAFELNVMLRALASRGKIRASLDLYEQEKEVGSIVCDAYTATTLFSILQDTIEDGQEAVVHVVSSLNNYTHSTASSSTSADDNDDNTRINTSPCWQWSEAVSVLQNFDRNQLNNHAYASALKLSERTSKVFYESGRRHYVANTAMQLLEHMKKGGLSPDVVTCTLVLSAFDKGYQWKAAVALLDTMVKQELTEMEEDNKNRGLLQQQWLLPKPNAYSYASAISACARCNECEEALSILNQMRTQQSENSTSASTSALLLQDVAPNTWVYNSALAACMDSTNSVATSSRHHSGQKRERAFRTAWTLLEQMQQDHKRGMDTAPDTVSYNTVLAAMNGVGAIFRNEEEEIVCNSDNSQVGMNSSLYTENSIVADLLEQMKERGIPRNAITYRNAIVASRFNGEYVLRLLVMAIEHVHSTASLSPTDSAKQLKGRAADGARFVFDAALSVLATSGDWANFAKVFSMMSHEGIQFCSGDTIYLITALSKSGRSNAILTLLEALKGDEGKRREIAREIDIDLNGDEKRQLRSLGAEHYSNAITSFLRENNLDSALQVLEMMRLHGLSPSDKSMQEIALAYSRLGQDAAAKEAKRMRKLKKYAKRKKRPLSGNQLVSVARARSAYEITLSLVDPPMHLLSTVAKACCAAGLWEDGRDILRKVHDIVILEAVEGHSLSLDSPFDNSAVNKLPGLHRNLLKLCASRANVTAALWFVEDIQQISSQLPLAIGDFATSTGTNPPPSLLSDFDLNLSSDKEFDSFYQMLNSTDDCELLNTDVRMKGEDWKLLMIAASKCGHWRVCLGTLQFLRPFLEASNPILDNGKNTEYLSRCYERVARSLTAAVLCFESRSQYAWAVRTIDDWIQWSGRRPRKEAVLSAFRILSARGRGNEVNSLLSRVLQVPCSENGRTGKEIASAITYEQIIFVGAITSLHNNGLYEDADELFVAGVASGHLPFMLADHKGDRQGLLTVDLHGMNTALAHSAVRVALQQEVQSASWDIPQESGLTGRSQGLWKKDMMIVTGRGRNSAQNLRPVLRPEVQRMLSEEFYPPLNTVSMPGNMGALRVPANEINAWLTHQRQQKGARLLAIVEVLKNFSSGNRIKQTIVRSLGPQEMP